MTAIGPIQMSPVRPVEGESAVVPLEGVAPSATSLPDNGVSFGDVFSGMVRDASEKGHIADAKAVALADGKADDLHGTMIASKEAEISLKLISSVRNKLLDAFHELWRTNV